MATLLVLPVNLFFPAPDALLVAGDLQAGLETPAVGRVVYTFDTTDEEAIVSPQLVMPSQYTGSGLTAKIHFAMKTATSSNVVWDVAIEAVTPDTDTLDMEASSSFDTVNSVTAAVPGTAGNPSDASVTLTNNDSVAAGDSFRIAIRRDTDNASDAAAGDAMLYAVEISDDG